MLLSEAGTMDVVMKKKFSLEWIKVKLIIVILLPTKFSGPVKFLWSRDFDSSNLLN